MPKLKILAMWDWLDQKHLEQMAAVDPNVEIIPALYRQQTAAPNPNPDAERDERRRLLASWYPNFDKHIAETVIIYGLYLPQDIAKRAPNLRWVQSYGAGLDFMPAPAMLAHGITITNSSPVNARPISEFCLTFMLMHAKRSVWRLDNQRAKSWTRGFNDELAGKTLGIIGPGHIGAGVAKRAAAFEMRVLATRRTYIPNEQVAFVDQVYPTSRLNEMLAECDYVVCSAPLTGETRHMLSTSQFAAMKPGSFFINISRGSVVDEPALTQALQSGHLSGAGLDVFEEEPLPANSALWTMPNVIITPHVTNGLVDLTDRSVRFFCENLKRYLNKQPLQAVIDPKKGY